MATATKPCPKDGRVTAKEQYEPLNDHVLVRRHPDDGVTAGGIVLPDVAQRWSQHATVIAVGPGKRNENGERHRIALVPGDEVVVNRYSGTDIDDSDLLVLKEGDIFGRVEPTN